MELTENVEPEKEPIQFDLESKHSENISELLDSIKRTAEKVLYHWKTFPIVLPSPISFQNNGEYTHDRKNIEFKDLFILPAFDELDAVALDTNGEQRRLTEKQLINIRDISEFEVDSVNFYGQVHRWKLSQLLQKGITSTYNLLLKDLSLAIRFMVITAKNRFFSNFFSISQSISKFLEGILRLLDMIIGVPCLKTNDIQAKLREERSKYLVAELVAVPDLEDDLDNLCLFVKQQIKKQSLEKYDIENEKIPKVPYLYVTPKGTEIDLRLFDKNVMKRALTAIAIILDREAKGWFHKYREKILYELKSRKLTDEEVERLANLSIMDEFMDRISNAILHDEVVSELGEDMGMLLIKHAWSILLMHRAVDNVHSKLYNSQNKGLEELKYNHPILSLIGPWVRNWLQKKKEKFKSAHCWSAHEEALMLCRAKQLNQANYFLNRDLIFMREREPVLLKELSRVKTPTRTFHWRTQIWFPQSWKITRVFQGQAEVIPNVISKSATSITNPRADPNQPVFLIEKQITRTTSSRWPFWRWNNYLHRTWSWTWNAMFIFAILIPWCSPVSFRALFYRKGFMPDLELSQVNGTLFPRKSSTTQTLYSRLVALWRHISKSRTEFESKPDTGFIGKGFTRHINRIWNYFVKGCLGTCGLVLIFPIMCLLSSVFSIIFAFTALFWMPIVTLMVQLATLVYDFDSPDESRNRCIVVIQAITWLILIQGIIQPILAFVLACVICPLISFFIVLFGVFRYSCRMLWDSLIFHIVIKRKGRIPAGDSFIVKRIAGPGLSSNYYLQIKPEQALQAFEAKLEIEELDAYKEQKKRLIYDPLKLFRDFISQVFNPFSASLAKGGIYKKIEKECDEIFAAVDSKVERRKKELKLDINVFVRSKVKLPSSELKRTIRAGAKMLEQFYVDHILKRSQVPEAIYWENRGLAFRDWIGLSGILFSEIFAPEFLIPLEETDTYFKLEVQHLDLGRFVSMINSAYISDDLGDVNIVSSPEGKIQILPPYIDLATFHPCGKMGASVHKNENLKSVKPWNKENEEIGDDEKLMIPLPLPHPCHIAIIIYNRENDDPIQMENEACQNVLKAFEESMFVRSSNEYMNVDIGSLDSQSLKSLPLTEGDGVRLEVDPSFESIPEPSESNHQPSHSSSQASAGESFVLNVNSSPELSIETEINAITYRNNNGTNV